MNRAQRIEALERVYRKLPKLACKGLCHEACGPIGASALEVERVERAGGKPLAIDESLRCSMLTVANRCSVYSQRPLVCRLFGAVERMTCQHGCKPERWVSDAEVAAHLDRIHHVGGPAQFSALPTHPAEIAEKP